MDMEVSLGQYPLYLSVYLMQRNPYPLRNSMVCKRWGGFSSAMIFKTCKNDVGFAVVKGVGYDDQII